MVYLREATELDMDLLYGWANDSEVRKNSFKTDLISHEDHVKWFHQIMKDENVLQFVLMEGDIPVGQIRLNLDKDSAEIGYSIAAEFRGKGYGHKILQLLIQKIRENCPQVKKLVAKVKPENAASKKLFESEGYDFKYLCYILDINN